MRVILNGKRAGEPAIRKAIQSVRHAGHAVDVRVTWETGDAHRYATEAVRDGIDCVVAGGGDGTINEIGNALLTCDSEGDVSMGVLPLGTANDFATAGGIPVEDPLAALRLVANQAATPIDVGLVNDRHFINVVSGGYGAEVTTVTDPMLKRTLGAFAYFLTGLVNVQTITPRYTRIAGPGFAWEGPVLAIAVSNGQQAGGGFRVGAKARVDDGMLDLMILPELPIAKLRDVIQDIQKIESSDELHAVVYRQLTEITIEAADGLQINLDGEPIRGERFEFRILPKRLNFVLPNESPLLRTR